MNKTYALISLVLAVLSVACIAEGYAFERALNPTLPIIPLGLVGLGLLSAWMSGSYFEQLRD